MITIPDKKIKSDFSMPAFGVGTWGMGGTYQRDPNNDDSTDVRALQKAIELGVTHIDTAEMYAAGRSEEILGEAIQECDRSKLFLVSKVYTDHLRHDDVLAACEASLKRARLEYFDLYLIHVPNSDVPMEETFKALDRLADDGLIRNVGVSNFSKERLEEASGISKHPIVVNQVHYNLMYREVEHAELLQYCRDQDIILEAWRPVQKGILTKPGFRVLDEMAEKYSKTHSQVAINWLLSQANVVTLAKASNLKHLEDNLGSLGWELETEDVEYLRNRFPDLTKDLKTVGLG